MSVTLAIMLLVLADCSRREAIPSRSNIALITIDTLRADHLGCYGYGRQTSPAIDSLAAGGIRFERAQAQWPKTGPSFCSIFTATYPKDNGVVRKVGDPLPLRFKMLAEALKDAGYGTAAVVANGAVGSEFNFDQGFDTFLETWKAASDDEPGRDDAAHVTRLALTLLPSLTAAKAPWFLWVHYLDPHFPYTPAHPWRDRFQGDALYDPQPVVRVYADRRTANMYGIGHTRVLDGRNELAFYTARYDAEIAYTDHCVGDLLDAMGHQGLLERTLVVVTADHGESLGDHHYYFDHGRFGFQATLHVPLIFSYPGVLEPRTDPDPVELIRIAPTLLQVAGIDLPGGRWMQADSLVPRITGRAPSAEPRDSYAFSEAGYAMNRKWQKAVRDRRFKLIRPVTAKDRRLIAGENVKFVLYDLSRDPGETLNVAEKYPADLKRLRRVLRSWWIAPPFNALVDADERPSGREIDPRTLEQLESLGYLQ